MNGMCPDSGLELQLRSEVEAVHAFIAAWFRGEVSQEQGAFDTHLANRLAMDLINIQPSGQVLSRDQLMKSIYNGHGSNEDFGITIQDFRLLQISPIQGVAVASYVEHQRGAKNTTPADNLRITTVLFQISGPSQQGPVWLHLHETALQARATRST